jgi:hypothetical protein
MSEIFNFAPLQKSSAPPTWPTAVLFLAPAPSFSRRHSALLLLLRDGGVLL